METVAMNMKARNTAHEALMIEEYGEEVMCAGWNPQLTLVGDSPAVQFNKHANLIAEWTMMDVDAFVKKMYEYQC
jgi:hypothetical protein